MQSTKKLADYAVGLVVVVILLIINLAAINYGNSATAQTKNSYMLTSKVHDLTAISAVTALSAVDLEFPVFQIHNDSTTADVYIKCRTSATAVTTITPGTDGVIHLPPGAILDQSTLNFGLSQSMRFNARACYFTQANAASPSYLQIIYPSTALGY